MGHGVIQHTSIFWRIFQEYLDSVRYVSQAIM